MQVARKTRESAVGEGTEAAEVTSKGGRDESLYSIERHNVLSLFAVGRP